MKKTALLLGLCLAAIPLRAGPRLYRLEYLIRGSAISRVLFVFPLRVFYEASLAVDLQAVRQEDGSWLFSYAGLPRPGHVLRTLGFSGKALALLTVAEDARGGEGSAASLLEAWRQANPEFAALVRKEKLFPHRPAVTGKTALAFERSPAGIYRRAAVGLEPRYRHEPARTGIYFNVFPLIGELLRLFNDVSWSAGENSAAVAWQGPDIDLSASLNRLAGLMEEAVKNLVTVRQHAPFRLSCRRLPAHDRRVDIRGQAFPDVPIWKGFMIREARRTVGVDPVDGTLLADELYLEIRNKKGQGGFGRLLLHAIETREEQP